MARTSKGYYYNQNGGTVYRITPSGTFTTLYSFTDLSDGANPGPLMQASDGNLYGTTYSGGQTSLGNGQFLPSAANGTIFRMPLSGGTPTTVYYFCQSSGCQDGARPMGPLLQASDGWIYGTTWGGDSPSPFAGSVFRFNINASGVLASDTVPGLACDIPGQCSVADPINIGNGNVYESFTDYTTAGQNPLAFTRTYNSLSSPLTYASSLGQNWRHNYDRYLQLRSPTLVAAERADGLIVDFTLTGGVWTSSTDLDYKLTQSGTTWTLTAPDDSVETYGVGTSSEAILQSVVARNGYTQTLTWYRGFVSTVTDSYRRTLSFAYDTNGHLTGVTNADGGVIAYAVSAAGQLTGVTWPTSPATSQSFAYKRHEPHGHHGREQRAVRKLDV